MNYEIENAAPIAQGYASPVIEWCCYASLTLGETDGDFDDCCCWGSGIERRPRIVHRPPSRKRNWTVWSPSRTETRYEIHQATASISDATRRSDRIKTCANGFLSKRSPLGVPSASSSETAPDRISGVIKYRWTVATFEPNPERSCTRHFTVESSLNKEARPFGRTMCEKGAWPFWRRKCVVLISQDHAALVVECWYQTSLIPGVFSYGFRANPNIRFAAGDFQIGFGVAVGKCNSSRSNCGQCSVNFRPISGEISRRETEQPNQQSDINCCIDNRHRDRDVERVHLAAPTTWLIGLISGSLPINQTTLAASHYMPWNVGTANFNRNQAFGFQFNVERQFFRAWPFAIDDLADHRRVRSHLFGEIDLRFTLQIFFECHGSTIANVNTCVNSIHQFTFAIYAMTIAI